MRLSEYGGGDGGRNGMFVQVAVVEKKNVTFSDPLIHLNPSRSQT